MATRYTRFDVSVYSLGGSSKLAEMQSVDFNTNFTQADGRAIGRRHQQSENVKRRNTFSARHFFDETTRPSNLNVTLMQIGANQLQTKMRSGSIRATTNTARGDAVGDFDEFLNADGTDVEINGMFMATDSTDAAILKSIADGNKSAQDVTVSITINGEQLVVPAAIQSCRYSIQIGDVQIFEITLTMKSTAAANGGMTSAFSGRSIWASILTGSAVVTFAITTKATGGVAYSGNAMITSANAEINNDALVNDNYEFQVQGTPTVSVTV